MSSTEVKVDIKDKEEKKQGPGLFIMMGILIIAFVGCMVAFIVIGVTSPGDPTIAGTPTGAGNICNAKKPTGDAWKNFACIQDDVIKAAEQSGADVTAGYTGTLSTDRVPITVPYYQKGLCPVNVHWHLGAEHRSAGEYDEAGHSPSKHRRQLAGDVRQGLQCHHYDANVAKFTTEYNWQHCEGMHVGETYEVHWPHSAAGACGTPNQYQTPFYDGVFCSDTAVGLVLDGTILTNDAIGVQAQIFTIVNDDDPNLYWPDLMRGMIVDGDYGSDIAAYTGSTTGTSRDNQMCSAFAPITWQVDRKCHMISASTFDKMCADMKAQRDDMSGDLHAHGARELVTTNLVANNHAEHSNPLFRE